MAVALLPALTLDDLGITPPGHIRRPVDEAGGVVATRAIRWLLGADGAGGSTRGDRRSPAPVG